MTTDSHYYTIEKPSVAEFKERGSKFIAYAFPIADVSEFKCLSLGIGWQYIPGE